jgi:hypothetical protein
VTSPRHPDCPFDPEEWDTKIQRVLEAMDKRSQYNQWVLGVGLAILMTIGGVIWAQMAERVKAIEETGSAPMRERLSRQESEGASYRRDIEELKAGQREILTILRSGR